MRIHKSRKRDCSFRRTEQDRALKHLPIDSLSTLGIRRCNAVSRTPAGESANRSARRHLGFDRHSAVRKRISKETGSSMNRRRLACLSSITVLCLLTCPGLAGRATAQDAEVENPRGMGVVMPPHLRPDFAPPPARLRSWNGSFTYGSRNYTYNMVGPALEQYDRDHYDLLLCCSYFGAPTGSSVNGWLSFQHNTSLSVCSNGS